MAGIEGKQTLLSTIVINASFSYSEAISLVFVGSMTYFSGLSVSIWTKDQKQFPVPYFLRLAVWWLIITSRYRLMRKSWYQQTTQLSVNKLLLILWHHTINFSFKRLSLKNELGDPHFLMSNCNQHDKMQLFAKSKKILRRGFRATLNFRRARFWIISA